MNDDFLGWLNKIYYYGTHKQVVATQGKFMEPGYLIINMRNYAQEMFKEFTGKLPSKQARGALFGQQKPFAN